MTDFQIIHADPAFVVCIKPPRVLSTDEPGGVPDLCRAALGEQNIRTVHRLDRVVSGLMVLARTKRAASDLSAQIRDGIFHKEYTAVLHGIPDAPAGTLVDLLARDKAERKTYVVTEPGKDIQEAILNYELLSRTEQLSKVRIELITGRTHQIRCQFSHHGFPLVGDRKYGSKEDGCDIALWSHYLEFSHPTTGEAMSFRQYPSTAIPWKDFTQILVNSK